MREIMKEGVLKKECLRNTKKVVKSNVGLVIIFAEPTPVNINITNSKGDYTFPPHSENHLPVLAPLGKWQDKYVLVNFCIIPTPNLIKNWYNNSPYDYYTYNQYKNIYKQLVRSAK